MWQLRLRLRGVKLPFELLDLLSKTMFDGFC